MINLGPIAKKVRETLVRREMAVSRLTSNGQKILDPQSESTIQLISDESMKSLWVKMFSVLKLGNKQRHARLYGGEVYSENGSYHEAAGYDKVYGTRTLYGNESVEPFANVLGRPIPGIIDFTCSYKGGLFAIREAQINWVAWDMEDLERLIPHFASPGKGVLLEWGYQSSFKSSVADTIVEDDMKNGNAYSKINELVLESGGTYDGIAGVISNFEWSLRDDGGFDVSTTIVSRGVNVLSKQIDQADAPLVTTVKDDSGKETEQVEVSPTLPEFVSAINEQIILLSVGGLGFFGGEGDKSRPLSNWDVENWTKESGTQPPGVAYFRGDSWINTEKNRGPYVTWGFFEDNILNKWCAKLSENGKITNQFRSIEPVLAKDSEGLAFVSKNGGSTNNINDAVMRSVIIGNNDYLLTPHLDRWVLPGQFPYNKNIDGGESNWFNLSDDEMTARVSKEINNNVKFYPFAVNTSEKGDGGYLRNMLIHVNLIEGAFKEAKNLQQGLQNLFDEINRDVNGFWSFQVVNDPYISGNIKVIDTKSTLKKASDYLKERDQAITDQTPKEETEMFVFDSWGERSIVKSNTLSVQLPSSFAVTAMYAGISNPKTDNTQGDGDATHAGKMMGGEAEDESQKKVYEPNKLFDAFGSLNPYLYDGAGSDDKGMNEFFGESKGHSFDNLDWPEILKKYQESNEDENKKKDKKTVKASQSSREPKCIKKFLDEYKSQEQLYDGMGNLREDLDDEIVFKRIMNNILSGTVSIKKGDGDLQELQAFMKKDRGNTDLLPIECELQIQGIGGIFPGNVFHVSYIPNRYKNMTLFQAMSVDHAVADGTWSTTIKGQVRIAIDELYEVINLDEDTDKVLKSDADPSKINSTMSTKDLDVQGPPAPPPPPKLSRATFNGKDNVLFIEANTFEEAFAAARADNGQDAAFVWRGNLYATRYVEEGYEGIPAGIKSSGNYTNKDGSNNVQRRDTTD